MICKRQRVNEHNTGESIVHISFFTNYAAQYVSHFSPFLITNAHFSIHEIVSLYYLSVQVQVVRLTNVFSLFQLFAHALRVRKNMNKQTEASDNIYYSHCVVFIRMFTLRK